MTPEKFKNIRRGNNLTQGRLADILGVSRHTVMRYEIGESPIPKSVAYCMDSLNDLILFCG